jgi:hypothetical protein
MERLRIPSGLCVTSRASGADLTHRLSAASGAYELHRCPGAQASLSTRLSTKMGTNRSLVNIQGASIARPVRINMLTMFAQAQTLSIVDGLAIILSVVSLIITMVGFFASLKFYRDGVELQKSANDALTKLEEKTEFIQTQVGSMFDKTLDAAIGKREILSDKFEELNEQLEKTKTKLIEESISQIGAAGEQERNRLAKIVDNQMSLIREKVEDTRESAEEMVQPNPSSLPHSLQYLLKKLSASDNGLTIKDITAMTPLSENGVRVRLRDLSNLGYIELRNGKYVALPIAKRVLG